MFVGFVDWNLISIVELRVLIARQVVVVLNESDMGSTGALGGHG